MGLPNEAPSSKYAQKSLSFSSLARFRFLVFTQLASYSFTLRWLA